MRWCLIDTRTNQRVGRSVFRSYTLAYLALRGANVHFKHRALTLKRMEVTSC